MISLRTTVTLAALATAGVIRFPVGLSSAKPGVSSFAALT